MNHTLTVVRKTTYKYVDHDTVHDIILHRIEETGTYCLSLYRNGEFVRGQSFDDLNEPNSYDGRTFVEVNNVWSTEALLYRPGVTSAV